MKRSVHRIPARTHLGRLQAHPVASQMQIVACCGEGAAVQRAIAEECDTVIFISRRHQG
jgi:hypothetical protein